MGNPFSRIGKSFPAGRRSDCFFGTLLMMRGRGGVAAAAAGVGGDESVNAK
jgi:hypothetical protein